MRYGISLTTFNRFHYLNRTLDSLFNSNILKNTIINISDDNSSDNNVLYLLNNLKYKYSNYIDDSIEINIYNNNINLGSRLHYIQNISRFKNTNIDMVINLDADCILNKSWMVKLDKILSLCDYNAVANVFYCDNRWRDPSNFILEHEHFLERKALHGLGLTFPSWFIPYIENEIIEGDHLDGYVSKKAKDFNIKCICSKESYIEHIGEYGVHSPNGGIACDKATNFLGEYNEF